MDFASLGLYFVFLVFFINQVLKDPLITTIYFILLIVYYVVGVLSVWLSFSFADREYYCLCKICDKCCLKAAKCVTRNRMDQVNDVSARITQQDFAL